MSENRWDGMSVNFRLDQATVTAILDEGGAIHEAGLELNVYDGRTYRWYPETKDRDQPQSVLAYECIINLASSAGDEVESVEAKINIDGVHENGRRLSIRGNGWIGRDQDKKLEVMFDSPPTMIICDDEA